VRFAPLICVVTRVVDCVTLLRWLVGRCCYPFDCLHVGLVVIWLFGSVGCCYVCCYRCCYICWLLRCCCVVVTFTFALLVARCTTLILGYVWLVAFVTVVTLLLFALRCQLFTFGCCC